MAVELLGKVTESSGSPADGQFLLKGLLQSLGKCFQGLHNPLLKITVATEYLSDGVCPACQGENKWLRITDQRFRELK